MKLEIDYHYMIDWSRIIPKYSDLPNIFYGAYIHKDISCENIIHIYKK
jgi:hypothetical protein